MPALTTEEKAALWKAGRLRYLLFPNQREVYNAFTTWNNDTIAKRERGESIPGKFPRLYVFDCSRRFGKDFLSLLILMEKAIQKPNGVFMYAAALQKEIADIATTLLPQITVDCPYHLRPVYRDSYRGHAQGIYFPNGSIIKLIGVDLNPAGLRGRHCDGTVLSETGFMADIAKTLEIVIEPQYLGRNHAFTLANSTPPEATADWDLEFCPDARDRGAYILRTIWQSHYSDYEKREFLKIQPDGTILDRQRREYLCERVREATKVVVPEFHVKQHVQDFVIPEFGHAYTLIDPAVKDLTAINYCVYDFARGVLLVVDEFTERNANTQTIADDIRHKEAEHYSKLYYWSENQIRVNPFLRVADIDPGGARLIGDLGSMHGIRVTPADKSGSEASLHSLRLAFQQNQILIHPRCKNTIEHLLGAIWNKTRSTYERTDRLGHCDHLDALKYGNRALQRSLNPYPPPTWAKLQRNPLGEMHYTKDHLRTENSLTAKLNKLLPKGWVKRHG